MKDKSRYIILPEVWDELSEADWRELLKFRQQLISKGMKATLDDVRIWTARMMLKNRGVKQQTGNSQYLVLVSQLAGSLDWLWQEVDGGLSLVYRSSKNLLPKIQRGTEKGHQDGIGPLSPGADLTFGEFRQAISHLKVYEQQQEPTALCALAGLLYRPKATLQQKQEQQLLRQPYDWDSLDDKIERGRQMKPWQVWGIYAWFAFFCEYLTTGIFTIEGEDVCFAPVFGVSGNGRKESGGGMAQICLTLAESHVFGTAKEVDRTPLLTVMLKLLQDYQTLQKLKNRKV